MNNAMFEVQNNCATFTFNGTSVKVVIAGDGSVCVTVLRPDGSVQIVTLPDAKVHTVPPPTSYTVPSDTKAGVEYEVREIGGRWTCSCPNKQYRLAAHVDCKHITSVKASKSY